MRAGGEISAEPTKKANVGSEKERSSPPSPQTPNPLCYFDKDAEVPGGKADVSKRREEGELPYCMWVKKAWEKNRGRERKEGVGTGWDGMRGREGRMLCRWFIKN